MDINELNVLNVRKRPIVVQAIEITPELLDKFKQTEKINGYEIRKGGFTDPLTNPPSNVEGLEVETLEGTHFGEIGSYLMIGIFGELYTIKKDVFEKTYDLATETVEIPLTKDEISTLIGGIANLQIRINEDMNKNREPLGDLNAELKKAEQMALKLGTYQ